MARLNRINALFLLPAVGLALAVPVSAAEDGSTPPAQAGAMPGVPAGETPNVLKALAPLPDTAEPFVRLHRTMLYGGTLPPEMKMAMGLAVAKETRVAYVETHMARLLRANAPGRRLLSGAEDAREKAAVAFATKLTRDVQGPDAAAYEQLRSRFNDAQIVELTMTTCYFNYLTRLCAGAGVRPEAWASAPASVDTLPAERAAVPAGLPVPRVALASDAELDAAVKLKNPPPAAPGGKGGTGLGYIANSQRAMVRVPDLMAAWFDYWKVVRGHQSTTIAERLQISFAVSMANGCRYCTLHQVQGLRRQGVDIAKLVAMEKDDSALTPRERAAVTFARKLTRRPDSITDADRAALKAALGEEGATEALLQTCAFAFMNRFTDSLRLPSEDEAVRTYQEVYGADAYGTYFERRKRLPERE